MNLNAKSFKNLPSEKRKRVIEADRRDRYDSFVRKKIVNWQTEHGPYGRPLRGEKDEE